MVSEQIVQRKILDERVIRVMEKIPRHLFVPEVSWPDAYEDRPIHIGYNQTISQPYIVALMTEALKIRPAEKVLEIGTGSGYQTAILQEMSAQIFSVEIIPELALLAEKNLGQAGYSNVKVKAGNGFDGWAEHAPFDAILVACATENVPQPLIEQLKEGGRMVIPIGPQNEIQELYLMKKINGGIVRQTIAPVRFVPMTGETRKEFLQ